MNHELLPARTQQDHAMHSIEFVYNISLHDISVSTSLPVVLDARLSGRGEDATPAHAQQYDTRIEEKKTSTTHQQNILSQCSYSVSREEEKEVRVRGATEEDVDLKVEGKRERENESEREREKANLKGKGARLESGI
ncbi:hypothetical protein EVAR_6539_1 [Eumeta japonica]|uniref:Uncharacterized protein n=1 Tax=Eumeta variegata TaxID=151549 RepID=A0A4C1SSV8_EUMVA|nr:hypothetical protein EVAR_6539_1 [Eumeta japonica]